MDFRRTYHDLVRHDIFPLLPERLGAVLDFGGGIGATAASLRAEGRATRAVLFDQVAERALPEIDQGEAIDLDDPEAISAALALTGPFDTILALDVLEHLKDPWKTVELLDSAVRPGGSLIISVPNIAHYSVVGPLALKGRFDYCDAGVLDRTHLRWFTRSTAIELATCSGLTLEAVQVNIGRRRDRLINAVSFGILERYLGDQVKIRARKPVIGIPPQCDLSA